MTTSIKKSLLLGIAFIAFSASSAFASGYTCRLTLASSGTSHEATKGIIHLRGYVGERATGFDEGTRFRYRVQVKDGSSVYCRGNRREALVSLYSGNNGSDAFITASTCFVPNEDFYIGSSADDHWIYFNCYSE